MSAELRVRIGQFPTIAIEGAWPRQASALLTRPLRSNFLGARGRRPHWGCDVYGYRGDPVVPMWEGRVVAAGYDRDGSGGWGVTIDSTSAKGTRLRHYYAHLLYRPLVDAGARVGYGSLLGFVGNSGGGPLLTYRGATPHVHIYVYQDGVSPQDRVDPAPQLIRMAEGAVDMRPFGVEDVVREAVALWAASEGPKGGKASQEAEAKYLLQR